MSNNNISSKELVTYFKKIRTLYDSDVLSFTEYTGKKEQFISELRYSEINEKSEDYMISVSELYKSNIINEEELSLIKEIILSNKNDYNKVTPEINIQKSNDIISYKQTNNHSYVPPKDNKVSNFGKTNYSGLIIALISVFSLIFLIAIISNMITNNESNSLTKNSVTTKTETETKPIVKNKESVQAVINWINNLGSGDFKSAYKTMKGKKWGDYSFFSSVKAYGGISKTKIYSCESSYESNSTAEVIADYDSYDPYNNDGRYKQRIKLEKSGTYWYITDISNIDIYYYRKSK